MTEETNTRNSKAVVVRRFTGFLILYYFIIYFSLGCSGFLIDLIAHSLGYYVGIGCRLFCFPGALFTFFLIAGIPIFHIGGLLYIFLFLYCLVRVKEKFICSPSKIDFFDCFILLSSFIVLLISYLFGIQGENEDYLGLPFIFANLSAMIFLIALALKSTFRKRIFMKKN